MATEVKFTMSVPAFDALRRVMRRDFQNDVREHERVLALPENDPARTEGLRQLMRKEHDRSMVERTLGFDSTKDEAGS